MDAPSTTTPPVTTPATTPPPEGSTTPPAANWTATLSDESLRGHQGLAKFQDVDSLAKSYIELEKTIGQKGVKPLTADSTPEEIAAYRTAMGVPEKPDGYDVGELTFPEEATPTQEQLGAFKGVAHELHLTPAQVKGILGWYSQDLSRQWNSLKDAQEADIREHYAALTKRYGADAPQLLEAARRYVYQRKGQAGLDALGFGPGQTSALGNNPVLLELLIESARLTGHDKFVLSDGGGALMNQQAAQQKYSEVAAKYYRSTDEGEKLALKNEMERLAPLAHS